MPANSGRSAERGLVESTQLSLLIPLLLLSIFAVVQTSLWFAGRATAQAAAMTGAEQGAILGRGTADAEQAASQVADRGGLSSVVVQVSQTATVIEVTVSARVPTVLPGDWSVVSASAHRVKEE